MFVNVQLLVIAPIVFSLICNTYIIKALNKINYPYKVLWSLYCGIAVAGALAFAVTWLAKISFLSGSENAFLISVISALIIFIIYVIGLYVLKAIREDEIKLVASILKKKPVETQANKNIENAQALSLISELQRQAKSILDQVIPDDAHIILLDYPNNTNVGDSLIWLGEIAYLQSRNLIPAYVCDVKNYDAKILRNIIHSKSVILMHGGGNFGTVWTEIHNFRLQVLSDFPHIPIVQLPQTLHFDDALKTKEMAEVIEKQGNFTLLARSKPSYEFARGHFSAKTHLCPDMAFFIGAIENHNKPVVDRFVLARTDHESSNTFLEQVKGMSHQQSLDIADWLTPSWQERFLHRIEIHSRWIRAFIDKHNIWLFYLWNLLSRYRLKRGVGLLARGHIVITDRLHAHILSVLLNIPHVIVDNNYGKIGNFHRTWTSNHVKTKFISDIRHLDIAIIELESMLQELYRNVTNNDDTSKS